MAEWLNLARLAAQPMPALRPVAWRDGAWLARADFLVAVQAWQAAFQGQPGLRFALYFEDSFDFAAALFGAWHAGKRPSLPGDAQPATLQRLCAEVDGLAGNLPNALRAQSGAVAELAPLDPATTTLHVHTSGSAGEPVAILKRLDQLEAEIAALQAAFGAELDAQGAALVAATVSHQHIYGLLFQVLWPLAAGRPFVARRLDYPEQVAALPGAGPCALVSSPAHLRRLPATADWPAVQARLRAVFSSGGPLPAEAAQQSLQWLGHSPTEVYGSSETGGIAWRRRALQGETWQALPGVEWRIEDGLLGVRSDRLADAAQWWRTTDRVRPGPNGGFELLGRADRIVKVEEKRISLDALERALLRGGELAEVRVLLLPAALGGRLAVVGVLTAAGRALLQTQGKRALNERLRAALLDEVERVALPRRWRYVATLPSDTQGKCTEAALASLFQPAMPAPRWLERTPARARVELLLDAGLRVFDGHFPGAPILPGVAQIDWAVALGRECFALAGGFQRADALKFQRPLLPGMTVELLLEHVAGSGVLAFRYTSADGTHAGGRLVFGAADV
ncbi:AMP-binding protein [Azohydromonas lata]|uniref:AMP-binding protein n=1 Tax=Azohydromonas lata TaxID=45677 RepID=A0ABU5IKQ0_9BURK|nr:AMP-binding protein [Azohydromonas lata]MDZ5459473.1 AMP-binding protein [Azohydromonas lata]